MEQEAGGQGLAAFLLYSTPPFRIQRLLGYTHRQTHRRTEERCRQTDRQTDRPTDSEASVVVGAKMHGWKGSLKPPNPQGTRTRARQDETHAHTHTVAHRHLQDPGGVCLRARGRGVRKRKTRKETQPPSPHPIIITINIITRSLARLRGKPLSRQSTEPQRARAGPCPSPGDELGLVGGGGGGGGVVGSCAGRPSRCLLACLGEPVIITQHTQHHRPISASVRMYM